MIYAIIYGVGLVLGLASLPAVNAYCETVYGMPMSGLYKQSHVKADSWLIWLDPGFYVVGSLIWPIAIATVVAIAALWYPVIGANHLLRYPGAALGRRMKRTVEVKQIHDRYRREAEAEVERLLSE